MAAGAPRLRTYAYAKPEFQTAPAHANLQIMNAPRTHLIIRNGFWKVFWRSAEHSKHRIAKHLEHWNEEKAK
jgi:hypothetical protein